MAKQKLDRKARTAVTLAGAILLAIPLFVVGKTVVTKVGEQSERQPFVPQDDQLVQLRDGSTLLVKHSSPSRKISEWLKLDRGGQETFEVGNGNFLPGTATLSRDGWEHVTQFDHMLKVNHFVSAVILFSPSHGDKGTLPLEHLRANKIHDEAVKDGVDERRISVALEAFEPGHNAANDPGLEVVLTRLSRAAVYSLAAPKG